jgi:hypothetical protein
MRTFPFDSPVPQPDLPGVSLCTAKQSTDPLTAMCHFE